MATSGSKTITVTSWNDLVFSWSVSSQSTANNTSTVAWTLKLVAGSSGRISSSVYKACSVTVNGTTYTGKASIDISNNSTKTLLTGTTVIKHNDDGTKTFSYSFSQEFNIVFSGTSIGTKTGSGTGTLDTIRRLSTISVTSGLLGSAQTITVTRQNTSFTHSISYKCGSLSGTVCTKSSSTSISFTPPLSLAAANTTGTTVNVTYTISTESGNVSYGTTSVTVTHTMPTSVKPSCSVSVSDATGHFESYGVYVKGLSKLAVTVTATPSYGAAISSYSTTVNGGTYTGASFTTSELSTSGTLTVSVKVKDTRGRTGTCSVTLTVLDYTPPRISALTVHRCDADGTENDQGEYVKLTFSAQSSNIGSQNSVRYTVSYKPAREATFTDVYLPEYDDYYILEDGVYIFAAASDNSYDVRLTVEDDINTATRSTSASTAFTMIHFGATGTGVAFGKLCENEYLADFGLQVRHSGGILNEVLEKYNDLNEVMIPNTYASVNRSSDFYANCPVSSGTFALEVMSAGAEGQLYQRLTTTFKEGLHEVYERHYYQGSWGSWICVHSDTGWIDMTLASGISVAESPYLKCRFKDDVLYIKGSVTGITTTWQAIARVPSGILSVIAKHCTILDTNAFARFTGVYNLTGIAGLVLLPNGSLNVTHSNFTGSFNSAYVLHINEAISFFPKWSVTNE